MKKPNKKLLAGCMVAAMTMGTALYAPVAEASPISQVSGEVTRLAGVDRYQTAALVSQKGWESSESAILAAGMNENLVDALTAAPLAKAKDAPILLTQGTSLNKYAESELIRLGVKTVYVTSGTNVLQQPVLDKLESMNIEVKSLGGDNRFETSVNIAKEMPESDELIVTTAWNNADALSVASIAASKGIPIVLSDVYTIPVSVINYIGSVEDHVAKSYVLGGVTAVSETVKNILPNPERIGGSDRYKTNEEILKTFANDLKPGQVFIANGQNNHLVDSLTASPLAAKSSSPIILTRGELSQETIDLVKLNLLPEKVVVLGGEKIVGANVTELAKTIVYSNDGAVKGSSDEVEPEVIQDVLKITGKDVTVKNTSVEYSIYVKGDNVTLENVTVKGTLFLDPGEKGNATIKGVTADKIVIMSGAEDSIHIVDTKAGSLVVSSDSNTRVEASGSTEVGSTVVTSYAILDAQGGNLGQVVITTEPGKEAQVELRGTFTKPVVVEGAVTLKAAKDAVIPSVVVETKSAEQKVTLDGAFKDVQVKTEAKVDLAENAKVESMKTEAKVEVTVPSTAQVDKLDAGKTDTVVSGGGKVNGEKTSETPSTPPATPGSNTGGSSGGGGGGGHTETFKLEDVKLYVDGSPRQASSTDGKKWTVSLPDSGKVTGIYLDVTKDAEFKVFVDGYNLNTVNVGNGGETLTNILDLGQPDNQPTGVKIETLKAFAEAKGDDEITLTATLTNIAKPTEKINLTLVGTFK